MGNGMGFLGCLTLLFVGLKLADIITWSWFFVLCPLFIVPVVVIILVSTVIAKILKSGNL